MSTIEDMTRAMADLEEAVTEHRKATERQQSAELLFNAARDDAVAAQDVQDETLQELVQLCGALLLQQAKPSKHLSRYAVYATQPVGRELMLDTGHESWAQTEHQRLETECPGSDPCIFRRVYVQLDSTAIPATSAGPGHQARQDAEITTRDQKEPA